MTTHDRQTMQQVQKLLKAARPEQIERLLRDIMKTDLTDNQERTGRA